MLYLSYVLFVISVFVYELYQLDFTLFIRSSNETALIEQALERIPTCNAYDRPRQRALLYTLQAWIHLAHSHHIRYWISHRTLIGYTQRQGPLPYDYNIDITIMAQDTPQLIELKKANYSSIYELKVHPQWIMVKTSNRSYFPSEGIDFKMQNARFINQNNNVSINIWPIYEKYPYQGILTELDNNGRWKSIAEEWIFPLRPCRFSGIKLWCPAQPQSLSASIYEQESVHCSNGIWIKSNEQTFDARLANL
jgi:hypothetical protein